MKKKYIVSTIIFFSIIFIFLSLKKFIKTETKKIKPENSDEISYNSNIIENVYYSSKDTKGNEYIIQANKGEIDYNNTNIIYLTNVKGFIKLTNRNDIKVTSEYDILNKTVQYIHYFVVLMIFGFIFSCILAPGGIKRLIYPLIYLKDCILIIFILHQLTPT